MLLYHFRFLLLQMTPVSDYTTWKILKWHANTKDIWILVVKLERASGIITCNFIFLDLKVVDKSQKEIFFIV